MIDLGLEKQYSNSCHRCNVKFSVCNEDHILYLVKFIDIMFSIKTKEVEKYGVNLIQTPCLEILKLYIILYAIIILFRKV